MDHDGNLKCFESWHFSWSIVYVINAYGFSSALLLIEGVRSAYRSCMRCVFVACDDLYRDYSSGVVQIDYTFWRCSDDGFFLECRSVKNSDSTSLKKIIQIFYNSFIIINSKQWDNWYIEKIFLVCMLFFFVDKIINSIFI